MSFDSQFVIKVMSSQSFVKTETNKNLKGILYRNNAVDEVFKYIYIPIQLQTFLTVLLKTCVVWHYYDEIRHRPY